MATVYGTNATDAFSDVPVDKVAVTKAGGRVRTLHDTYEADAAASGTIAIMGGTILPAGARILPSSTIQHDDLGTGGTIDLSIIAVDDDTETAIIEDLAAGSAATVELDDIAYIGTIPYAVTEDSYVAIVVHDAAATGTIVVNIEYTVD